MDAHLMAELEVAAGRGRPPHGDQFANARDDSAVSLDASDLVEEGDEDQGGGTDRHALPEALGTELDYREPLAVAPAHLTHRPTEPLSPAEAASPYATPPLVDPGTPLTAQPTMIYRDPTAPSARVLVVGGNDRGREFELTSDEISIGRGADCDIVLADIAVSRRHVVLFRDGIVFRCRDQRSGNGTSVNGRKLEEVLLANGDQIELGNTVLRFVVTGDAYVDPARPAAGALAAAASTPGTAPPAHAAPHPAYGEIPQGAPSTVTLPPTPYSAADPFAQAVLPAAAGGAYTPIVAPRGQSGAKAPKPRRAGTGGGPLTRLTATRQGKLVTFGSLGLALLLVSAAFVKRVVLPKRRAAMTVTVPKLPAPEMAFETGVRKFREHDWEGAKSSFEMVLAQVPEFQGAKKYAERCALEIRSREQLAVAKAALAKQDFAAAKVALKDVDLASSASDEATKLSRTVPQREVEVLLVAAKKLQAEEDFPSAKAKVEQALAVQPDHGEAMALKAELDRAKPKTAKERAREARLAAAAERAAAREAAATARKAAREGGRLAAAGKEPKAPSGRPREEPKAPSGKPGKEPKAPSGKPGKERKAPPEEKLPSAGPVSDRVAMQHYRAREWGMAIATLKQLAGKQRGRQQTKTLAMAEDIRKVGQAFNRAENAAGKSPATAVGLYVQAAALDRRVGKGAHGAYLTGRLSKLSRGEAQRALQSGRYEQAYSMVKTAQRHGGDDATTRTVTAGLESKAKELFERGYQLKGQRPDEAKGLWRRVLRMVPSSSQWYTKAYKYLNETAGPRQRDEDE